MMHLEILTIWLLFALVSQSSETSTNCSHSTDSCTCSDFTSLADLDTSQCHVESCEHINIVASAGTNVILEGDILPSLQYFSQPESKAWELFFFSFSGVDLRILANHSSMFVPLQKVLNKLYRIRYTHLEFKLYLDKQPLQLSFDKNAPPGKRCNESLFVNMFGTNDNIFNLNTNMLHFLDPHFSSSNLCPFIFQYFSISSFNVYGFPLQFDTTEYSNLKDLRSTISDFLIYFAYKLNLDNSTLHPYVYGTSLESLNIFRCSINKVDQYLFTSFKKLRSIELILNNPRFFYHTNGIEWTHSLNSGLNSTDFALAASSSFFMLTMFTESNDDYLFQVKFFPYFEYKFPDEDYCLFKNFPHERLVVAFIAADSPINCSATLYSLVKNYSYYQSKVSWMTHDRPAIWTCFDGNMTWMGRTDLNITCSIDQPSSPKYEAHYFDLYDLKNQIIFFKKWLLSIFGPVACLIGCITNALVIFTIKSSTRITKKRLKMPQDENQKHSLIDPKQPFFVYMLINAVINLINCLMFFFYYVIKCEVKLVVDHGNISPICYIETVTVNIVSSVLKLLSNFTFLQMSVNRYALVGKDHYKFLLKIANMRIRKYIGWSILVSLALSVVVYFQQHFFSSSINDQIITDDYYYNDYSWYGYETDDYNIMKRKAYNTTLDKLQQLSFLSGFTMIHDLFSYFLFCIIITVIDAMTVVRLKRVLNEKKQILAKATSQAKSAKKQKAQTDEIEKSEKKSIAMIVLNSLAIFILRFPELISVIFFYNLLLNNQSYYTFKMLCFSYRQCLAVLDLSSIFYLFSLSLNFIFYYLFNLSFKTTFSEATDLFKKWLNEFVRK